MKQVLIIEDDFYVRDLYKMAFEKKGYGVVEAENGKVGLEKIKQDKFSFIVLDLMLPGMTGMEVLKKIKASTSLPVYVLTNVGEEQALKEAVQAGADAYFLKVNYTPKQLVEAIEKKESSASQENTQ